MIPGRKTPKASGQGASGYPTVVVIGGGFSGSMLAVELLHRSAGTISVLLIERAPLPGRGVAYGTQFEGHLLNVRAKNMSAYADVPDHLVKWAQPTTALPSSLMTFFLAGLRTIHFVAIERGDQL